MWWNETISDLTMFQENRSSRLFLAISSIGPAYPACHFYSVESGDCLLGNFEPLNWENVATPSGTTVHFNESEYLKPGELAAWLQNQPRFQDICTAQPWLRPSPLPRAQISAGDPRHTIRRPLLLWANVPCSAGWAPRPIRDPTHITFDELANLMIKLQMAKEAHVHSCLSEVIQRAPLGLTLRFCLFLFTRHDWI